MDVLPPIFRSYYYCGLWVESSSNFVLLRRCLGYFLSVVIYYFTITEVIQLCLFVNNVHFINVMYITVTFILVSFKIVNLKVQDKSLREILDSFRQKRCRSQSSDEEIIFKKYDIQVANIFKSFMALSVFSGIFLCFSPLLARRSGEYVLPFKSFQFYDDAQIINYCVTYIIHAIALMSGIVINVTNDSLIYGLIILATCQFELISYRIMKSAKNNDKMLLKQCIDHHIHVNRTIYQIQTVFTGVIAPMFLVSLLSLCTSIFHTSQVEHIY